MAVSIQKIQTEAPALVSLAKKAATATTRHGLDGQAARVALCLDYSGSADHLYRSGAMQRAAERILAVATQFDDDGAIDVFAFDSTAAYLGELTLSNYQGGIDRLLRGRRMGGTQYAAAFDAVLAHYGFTGAPTRRGFFRRAAPSGGDRSSAVYCAFLTDGDAQDSARAAEVLRAASEHPVFFQSVGLGRSRFDFLEAMDTMSGRRVDNAGFFTTPDIDATADEALLDLLLGEFPRYLTAARAAGVLA